MLLLLGILIGIILNRLLKRSTVETSTTTAIKDNSLPEVTVTMGDGKSYEIRKGKWKEVK